MKHQKIQLVNVNETNISLTAYRALYILALLMERPYRKNELIGKLKYNKITSKSSSGDTLRVTINTLKYAGCIISRPTLRNNYHYVLLYHPFCLDFTETEINVLNTIRTNITKLGDWKVVFDINNFYNRIIEKTNNEKHREAILNSAPFQEIDSEFVDFLSDSSIRNKEIIVEYDSARNGLSELKVIVDKIFFQDDRLYLWCYLHKYESYSYLRLDKIKRIKNIAEKECSISATEYQAEYILTGDSVIHFKPAENEVISEKSEYRIVVKANVVNEFNFIQRLLNFGIDFYIVSPKSLRHAVISKLDLMLQGYET